jgi:acyl-coenzyme A synthetase/AMP-(fatty) acid ligase
VNVPEHFNFAQDVIDELASHDRRGLLFVAADGTRHDYTFVQISDASQRYAAALRDQGIERGSRVIVALPKIPQWLFVMLALDRLGAIAIPGPEQLRTKDLVFRAGHAEAVAMIGDATNLGELQAARKESKTVRAGFSVRGGAKASIPLRTSGRTSFTPAARPRIPKASCTIALTRTPNGCRRSIGSTLPPTT